MKRIKLYSGIETDLISHEEAMPCRMDVSINGNDTAQDLKQEYTCAFFYYSDVEEAVQKIEDYAASQRIDKSDPEEYCDYVYSLADFMWKKGILTDEIRDRALRMIDTEFGLEIWEESGEKMLQSRKAALVKFRKQLLSPMGERKRIRPNVYMNEIFTPGDLVAIKLQTAGKKYSKKAMRVKEVSAEKYASYDGKYILIQKVGTHVSWRSSLVPEVRDCWAIFRFLDGVYDSVPAIQDINVLREGVFNDFAENTPYFICESSMFYFRKRDYTVIGNFALPDDVIDADMAYIELQHRAKSVNFGIYNEFNDADSDFIAAIR